MITAQEAREIARKQKAEWEAEKEAYLNEKLAIAGSSQAYVSFRKDVFASIERACRCGKDSCAVFFNRNEDQYFLPLIMRELTSESNGYHVDLISGRLRIDWAGE